MRIATSQIHRLTLTRSAVLIALLIWPFIAGLADDLKPSAARFPPAPMWPGEDRLPPSLAHQYVFLSPGAHALIIRVPTDSDYVRSGKPRIIRYDLHNNIRPAVSSRIGTEPSGKYVFDYVVSNMASAKDDIATWDLVIPTTAGEEPVVTGQNGWAGGTSSPAIFRNVELPDQPKGRLAGWLQDNDAGKIAPGKSQSGFRVESSCMPGFTTALFGSLMWVSIDQELPQEVYRQMGFYEDPAWIEPPALTFGPMFCEGASRESIVQNMISGIERSVELKAVGSGSLFIQDALTQLHALVASESAAPVIAAMPIGAVEQQIFQVLQLNLSFRLTAR